MTPKQLVIIIGVTVVLSLVLAWTIEKAQIRRFMLEFDEWHERKNSGTS